MSTVRANNYYDASGGSNAQLFGVASPPNSMGFRNRIINGDMRIDQRNAGASVTQTTANTYTLDRWVCAGSVTSKFTVQQNAGSLSAANRPAGFSNYLGVTSSAATTVSAGDFYYLMQGIEGFNVADLGWGTANAQTVTLSFWVRSSLTGTFGGTLRNLISSATRSYPFTYTISSANTWEYKTINVAGDTSGTWATDNSCSLTICFGLGAGSTFSGTAGAWAGSNFISATGATSVVGTNGATFYITGVQLEAGTNASAFERRPYGTELMLCQRYFARIDALGDTVALRWSQSFPVPMRAAPTNTVTFNIGSGGAYLPLGATNTSTTAFYMSTANSSLGTGNISWSAEL